MSYNQEIRYIVRKFRNSLLKINFVISKIILSFVQIN